MVDEALECSPFSHLVGAPFIMPVHDNGNLARFSPSVWTDRMPPLGPAQFATWLVKDEIFYSLLCMQDPVGPAGRSVMVLYDHETECFHYLWRDLWIPECPADTTLLGHFIWDALPGDAPRPNFLLFDTLQWAGKDMRGVPPPARYEHLRSLRLPEGSVLSLQFVGERQVVERFVQDAQAGRTQLPHAVAKSITLTDDPFRPVYHQLPPP